MYQMPIELIILFYFCFESAYPCIVFHIKSGSLQSGSSNRWYSAILWAILTEISGCVISSRLKLLPFKTKKKCVIDTHVDSDLIITQISMFLDREYPNNTNAQQINHWLQQLTRTLFIITMIIIYCFCTILPWLSKQRGYPANRTVGKWICKFNNNYYLQMWMPFMKKI